MGFELTIASKHEAAPEDVRDVVCVSTSIDLDGTFDRAALRRALETVCDERGEHRGSVLVRFHDVVANDEAALAGVASDVMRLRRAGRDVQIVVDDRSFHGRMSRLPDARDWLVGYSDREIDGPRRAIHVDGPR